MAEETNSNNEERTQDRSESRDRRSRSRSSRSSSRGRRSRGGGRRGHVCQFCADQVDFIDYKDVDLLEDFVSRSGRILPRRKTGTCAKHQRMVSKAIKRARHLALLPFSSAHTHS